MDEGLPRRWRAGLFVQFIFSTHRGSMSLPFRMRVCHSQDQEPFFRYIREYSANVVAVLPPKPPTSPLSRYIPITCEESSARSARNVPRCSALRVASQLMIRRPQNRRKPRMTVIFSIAPICKASFSASVLLCLSSYITTNSKIHLAQRTRSERANAERRTR
jgi:hypothetical protein